MDGKLRNMTSLYILKGDKILLLYRVGSRVVTPSWCGIGGHFEKEELNDARACVLREASEEIGLREGQLSGLRLRYITMRLKHGEVRQNYYFFGELKDGDEITSDCCEGKLRWFPIEEAEGLDMPVTAKLVLKHYLSTGRDTDELYGGITTVDGLMVGGLTEF